MSNDEGREAPTKQQLEEDEANQRTAPTGRVVYRAILKEGTEELERPSSALFWSGLAAGLSMGFSLVAEGLLQHRLPPSDWSPLVSKLGYSVGFLIVILGRQQLFTENTLTPILPLLSHKDFETLANVIRLWIIVLAANLLGCLAIAWACVQTSSFESGVREQFLSLGREAMEGGFGTIVLRAIFAGWLIALMVWLLPFAEAGRIWVIIILTYIVGLGGFSHIIAGAVKVFTLGFHGDKGWVEIIAHYVLPTLIGNLVGGMTLVAALNHAQVVSGAGGEDI